MEIRDRFKVVEVSGGAHDRGYQYGAKCENAIKLTIDEWKDSFCKHYNLSKDQLLREARKYIPFIEDYSPEIAEEIKGTAEGSGRQQEEIVMITAGGEIANRVIRLVFGMGGDGCTSFAATSRATINGETYIGQNDDEEEILWMNGKSYVLVNFKRKSGPNVLTHTFAGFPAMMGVNSAGIALCMNFLVCKEAKVGVPIMVIGREILQQKNMSDALGAIIRANRARAQNFLIAKGNDEIYDVEFTPNDLDYFYVDEYFAHSNHYLSKKFQFKIISPNTITRYHRMNKLLKEKSGKIDLETLMEFLKDHQNHPNSICRHPNPNDPPIKQFRTFGSMVFVPAKREFWIARGNPCESKFHKYSV